MPVALCYARSIRPHVTSTKLGLLAVDLEQDSLKKAILSCGNCDERTLQFAVLFCSTMILLKIPAYLPVRQFFEPGVLNLESYRVFCLCGRDTLC